MSIELQKRDHQILKYVFAFRVVTAQQITNRYFAKKHKTVALRRITQLCDAGFLKGDFMSIDGKPFKFVQLGEKAWPKISDQWPYEIDSPHFKSESPKHDVRLAEVLFKFEQLKAFKAFLTENLLQSSLALSQDQKYSDLAALQADGALILNSPEGRPYVYAFEFEISKKAPERYKEKLASYYHAGGIDGVIYVCSDNEIINSLKETDREVCKDNDSILYFGLEQDVLKSQGSLHFKNAKEHGIKLF